MQKKWLSFCFITLGLLISLPTIGGAKPSFSCKGKLTANEKLICKNSALSDLDKKITESYYELTSILNRGAADLIRSDQRVFLRQRQKCRHKFNCTKTLMQFRLNELTRDLKEQQGFRDEQQYTQNEELYNEENREDDICGPGYSMINGKCIHNAEIEQKKIIGNRRPLPSGEYGIFMLSNDESLRMDARADKLLYTEGKAGNRRNAKQSFFVIFQNGSYSFTDKKSGLRLHADDGGDKQISARYQPRDDFTKFHLERAYEGCFYVRVVATGNYWSWRSNSQTFKARRNPDGENSMFCFVGQ